MKEVPVNKLKIILEAFLLLLKKFTTTAIESQFDALRTDNANK